MLDQIIWLGNSSFLLKSDPLIYINPWRVTRDIRPADLILISDEQYNHCSPADIQKLRGPDTLIIGSESVCREIEGCQLLRPWQSITLGRACIKGVPAYSDSPNTAFIENKLGFLISLNYYDIYYTGDTQITPEMTSIHPDIAILPIDGRGTLTPMEAAQVVNNMRPKWAIPYNWDTGTRMDAHIFADAVTEHTEVIIKQPGETVTVG